MQPPTRAWRPTNRDRGPSPMVPSTANCRPQRQSGARTAGTGHHPLEVKGGSSQTVISTREAMKAASSLRVGRAQVQPHHRARPLQDVGNLGGRAVLGLQHPPAVPPRTAHASAEPPERTDRTPQPAHDSHRRTRPQPSRRQFRTHFPSPRPGITLDAAEGPSTLAVVGSPTAAVRRNTGQAGLSRPFARTRYVQAGPRPPALPPKWNTTTLTGARGASSGGRPG
jgi:hypothetical protein